MSNFYKFFFLICPLMLSLASTAISQGILNPGFENWSLHLLYSEPDSFITSNMQSYFSTGHGNVLADTNRVSGNYAVTMSTVAGTTDTVFGGIFIGVPSSGSFKGGRPYQDKPDSLFGFAKYNIMPNDTGMIVVFFKKMGTIMGYAAHHFVGSSSNYSRFSIHFTYLGSLAIQPDSIMVMISCSNLNATKYPGSTLTLDSLTFTGTSVAPFPFGGFETWHQVTTKEPDHWSTLNYANVYNGTYSATPDTDSYSGQYSLCVKNVLTVWNDTIGYVTNGYMGNGGPAGGMAINGNPDTLTFWYKYAPVGPDTAFVYVYTAAYDTALHQSSTVDMQILMLPAQSTYTKMQIPFSYNSNPQVDTINITISSGNIMTTNAYAGLGSTLKIDSLSLSYKSFVADLEMLLPSGNFSFCNGDTNQHISVAIRNRGNTAIPAGAIIQTGNIVDANPQVIEYDTLQNALQSGATIQYTFSHTTNLSAFGAHTYKFWLSYQADTIHSDDTTSGIATMIASPQIAFNGAPSHMVWVPSNNFPYTIQLTAHFNSISWTDSAGTSLGTDSTLSVSGYGWYYVSVDNGYGCTATDSIEVLNPMKINDMNGKTGFVRIYPNPGNGNFIIAADDIPVNGIFMQVCSVEGKLLKTYSINNKKDMINLDGFEKGLYFINIFAGSKRSVVKLVIN